MWVEARQQLLPIRDAHDCKWKVELISNDGDANIDKQS